MDQSSLYESGSDVHLQVGRKHTFTDDEILEEKQNMLRQNLMK